MRVYQTQHIGVFDPSRHQIEIESHWFYFCLRDEARVGAPCKFTAEQICQIMIASSERPEDIGLPISHWSITSLRDELIKRGIVDDISCSHLAVFLNQGEIKPHKIKEWLHTL